MDKEAGKYKVRPLRTFDELNLVLEKWRTQGITVTAAAKKLEYHVHLSTEGWTSWEKMSTLISE